MGSCTKSPVFPTYVVVLEKWTPVLRPVKTGCMLEPEKIIATTKSHREPPVFARKRQNGVAQARAPRAEARSLSWTSSCSRMDVPRRSAWLLPQINTRSDGTLSKRVF